MSALQSEVKATLDTPLLTFAFDATVQAKEEKDFLLPIEELKRRADAGNANAQYLVGLSLLRGMSGCAVNKVEAEKWIGLAKKSVDSPAGLCAQGICAEAGMCGVLIKNRATAKDLYSKAAKLKYIPAIHHLAWIFGDEEREAEKAIKDSDAPPDVKSHSLATLAVSHQEIRQQIVAMMTRCAEQGYALSQNYLGWCFETGWGVKQDFNQSTKLYQMAAESAYVIARHNFGMSLEQGRGTPVNIEEAKKWYRLAAGQGHEKAQRDLQRLNNAFECCTCS